jgi:hypothetical protein
MARSRAIPGISEPPPNFSPFEPRKAAAIIASVRRCPISHLSHIGPISSATGRPIPHLYRPIPSLLTAQNLTRLSPLSHRTRPLPHFSTRKPLKMKADLPPESESELNRTLEGKSRSTGSCAYVDSSPFLVSLKLDRADAKPLRGLRCLIALTLRSRIRAHSAAPPSGQSAPADCSKDLNYLDQAWHPDWKVKRPRFLPVICLARQASGIFGANLTGFGARRKSPCLGTARRSIGQTHVRATHTRQKIVALGKAKGENRRNILLRSWRTRLTFRFGKSAALPDLRARRTIGAIGQNPNGTFGQVPRRAKGLVGHRAKVQASTSMIAPLSNRPSVRLRFWPTAQVRHCAITHKC